MTGRAFFHILVPNNGTHRLQINLIFAGLLVLFAAGCASGSSKGAGGLTLSHPVDSKLVTSGFGPRNGRMHHGIDYAAPTGTLVKAVAPGRVIFVGTKRGYGRTVIIRHNNELETWYAHLSKIYVDDNERVAAGERIGRVGTTGNATGPHLHLETRINGRPVNPQYFFR